eukprot:3885367-Karenia_brevis.AAC.1
MGWKLAMEFVQYLHGKMHATLSSCPRPLPEQHELRKDRPSPLLERQPSNMRVFWQKYCDDFDIGEIRKASWASDVATDFAILEELHQWHLWAKENYDFWQVPLSKHKA